MEDPPAYDTICDISHMPRSRLFFPTTDSIYYLLSSFIGISLVTYSFITMDVLLS